MAKRRRRPPTDEDMEYLAGAIAATTHFVAAICLALPAKRKRIHAIFSSQAHAVVEELMKKKATAVGVGYVDSAQMIEDFLSGKTDEPPTVTH